MNTRCDEDFQKRANDLAMRLFKRRFSAPEKALRQLLLELRERGLIRVRVRWLRAAVIIQAEVGRNLRSTIAQCRLINATEIIYGAILTAARNTGFAPLYEDLGVQVEGNKVFSTVDAVPLATITHLLDRDVPKRSKVKRGRHRASSRN